MMQSAVCDVPVVGAGETGELSFRPTAYGGHAYFVRKCVSGESFGGDDAIRQLGGIVMPDSVDPDGCANNTFVGEVIGIGPRVGMPCNATHFDVWAKTRDKDHPQGYRRARCIEAVTRKGDFVLLPDSHPGIKRSPGCDYEFSVEESVPLAILQIEGEPHE